jgi:hypothetical protein
MEFFFLKFFQKIICLKNICISCSVFELNQIIEMIMNFTAAYMVLESLHWAKRLLVPCAVVCESFLEVSVRKILRGLGNLLIISKLRSDYAINFPSVIAQPPNFGSPKREKQRIRKS